jgi:SAM-dependent methyltransferase
MFVPAAAENMKACAMGDPNSYYTGGLGVAMYDLFTGAGLLAGDVAFYLDCARRFGGPILELGTGTGRVLIPLAEAGHEVVGLDLSPAMLGVAKAYLGRQPDAAARVRLVEGDMTDFDLGQRFALALIAARSFQHVTSPAGQRATLRCVRRHMVPGGHLILDLFDPNFELLFAKDAAALPSREALHPGSGNRVRRAVVARHADPLLQIVEETLRFEEFDPAGRLIACEETSWALRWSTRQETAYLLELCGFAPVEQFSDFKRSPPDYGREQLWVARAA